MNIFNTFQTLSEAPDAIEAIYDLVEAGNLFFYDRGSADPQQFQFAKIDEDNEIYRVLPVSTNDPRLAEINVQRQKEANEELEQYEQYQASQYREKVLKALQNNLPNRMENARQRAHSALSLTNPGPLTFDKKEVTFSPVQIPGGSRFKPAQMELIVLACCDTLQAAEKNDYSEYVGLDANDKMTVTLGVGIHDDVLTGGRQRSEEFMFPVFEEGRRLAAELITQDINGDSEQLKQVLMNSLRNHIQSCRDRGGSMGPTTLRMFEAAEEMAVMMKFHKLYTDENEFKELEEEAKALGLLAKIVLDGAAAQRELQEALETGFKNENQRMDIVARIVAARYVTARELQADRKHTSSEDFLKLGEEIDAVRDQNLPLDEMRVAVNRLEAQRIRSAPMRDHIREIIDEMKLGGAFNVRLGNYALITEEGKKLLAETDPFRMIEEVTKLAPIRNGRPVVDELTAEIKSKRANRMDKDTATEFWKNMLWAMGAGQFDLKLMENDFSRLVVQTVGKDGKRSLTPLNEALGITSKDMLVYTMDDAEMMERLRDQLAQGNVFFYERGKSVPRRLTLDENGVPKKSAELEEASYPGAWARFAYLITGGRAYREENEAYEQELHMLNQAVVNARATQAADEVSNYANAQNADQEKRTKDDIIDKERTLFWDMSKVRERAHNILSLDDPKAVPFEGDKTPDYAGKPLAVSDKAKQLLTPEQLDALCLAGISSPAAAKAHMETGLSFVFGSTPESTAKAVEGHIYNDLLVWGRYDSEPFFPLLDAGRQEAATALSEYVEGKPDRMAQLLGHAIRATILSGRFDQGVKSNAALAGEMAERMMGMLDGDPDLKARCGIDENTLEGYRQELKGLRMIGQAYENAGNAYRQLADAVREGRTLSEEESLQIATDLQTYRYLNSLQCTANQQMSEQGELGRKCAINSQPMLYLDPVTKEPLDPRLPDTMIKMAEGKLLYYHFSPVEVCDRQYESKMLFDKPLPAIEALGNETLEDIRNRVKATEKVQDLSQFTDPLAFGKRYITKYGADIDTDLVSKVSSSRRVEEMARNKEQQNQIENQIKELNGAAKAPDQVLANPDPSPVQHQNSVAAM